MLDLVSGRSGSEPEIPFFLTSAQVMRKLLLRKAHFEY